MKDGDLSSDPIRRYYVVADTVFIQDSTSDTKRDGWFSRVTRERTVLVPNLRTMSFLWQWSSSRGVRLELIFYEERATDAGAMWDLLERSAANPFSDWHIFASPQEVQDLLPYRPDLLGVVDLPQRSAMYGARGLQLENLR